MSGQNPPAHAAPRPAIREPRTSFLGREGELMALVDILGESRLVTVTGAGGVGKTRLAARAANTIVARDGQDACFIGLESVTDPDRVPLALLRGLGLADRPGTTPLDVIARELAHREMLVVLDNCEHLLDVVADLVDELLDLTPGLTVLATSRRALDVDGERVLPLSPLPTESEVAPADAVRLLRARARDAGVHLGEDGADAAAAVELCRALDGMPLAIELAAVRLRSLTLGEVTQRLSARFALLQHGPRSNVERQRTLRAVVDWSYELCTPVQRRVWQSLAVFSGSFTTAAALAVCTADDLDETAALDALSELVAQSLVEPGTEPGRHRLLETMRDYARERAREDDTWAAIRLRHLDHVRRRVADHRSSFLGPGQAEALAALSAERFDVQSALDLAATGAVHADVAASLVADLRYVWAVGGFAREGRTWTQRALQWDTTPPVRAELLSVAAWLALLQGDLDAAASHVAEATMLLDAVPLPERTHLDIELRRWRGSHALFSGDLTAARDAFADSIRLADDAGLPAETLLARFQLTVVAAHDHDPDPGVYARQAVEISQRMGETWMRSHALWSLSVVALVDGRLSEASALLDEAIGIDSAFDDYLGSCLMLETWSAVAARDARPAQAAVVLGALSRAWDHVGSDITAFGPHLRAEHVSCVEAVRSALGPSAMTTVLREGAGWELPGALEYAQTAPRRSDLSRREREIAGCVHRGMSNRDIANDLVLSIRTVETHVQHIYTKLGISSRAELGAWYERDAASHIT